MLIPLQCTALVSWSPLLFEVQTIHVSRHLEPLLAATRSSR